MSPSAWRLQVDFARAEAPFWHRAENDLDFSEEGLKPLLSKSVLREVAPHLFVPLSSKEKALRCFATSGTTGTPTFSFFSEQDWKLKVQTLAQRWREQFRIPERIVALNCYTSNHLAGQLFQDSVLYLGGTVIPAGYFCKSSQDLQILYNQLRCNVLIMGEAEGSYKYSIGTSKLFSDLQRANKKLPGGWWISSGPTNSLTLAMADALGFRQVTTSYGCSEFGFLAVGCRLNPLEYHLLGGDTLVEKAGQLETGLISLMVTRLGAPHEGSQYLRFLNGDQAQWIDHPCACGVNSARLTNIQRI